MHIDGHFDPKRLTAFVLSEHAFWTGNMFLALLDIALTCAMLNNEKIFVVKVSHFAVTLCG